MTYATIQEVNTSIMFSNFTNEQLNSINDAVSMLVPSFVQ
jgi:hypothetical protein